RDNYHSLLLYLRMSYRLFNYLGSVMAFGRVRTGIRPRTDRHLSVPRSGRFLSMVRPGRVGPTSVKYPRNPGQIQESLKTDRVFITSNMDVTGRVLKL